MKCNRCGEECKENQVFCIKCGSPIHVVPDFDLIQAELANSVGKLMSDNEEVIPEEGDETITKNFIPGYSSDENEDKTDVKEKKTESETVRKNTNKKPKKNNRLMILLISVAVVLVAVVTIIVVVFVLPKDSPGNFAKRYEKGMSLFQEKEYEEALEELLVAENLSQTEDETIQVLNALVSVYSKMDGKTQELIDTLKKLIDLDSMETEYYVQLGTAYESAGMIEELQNMINTADADIYEEIRHFGVSAPVMDPVSGEFDEGFIVNLTADNAAEIYYTIDGSTPGKESTLYKEGINVFNDGEYTIKAVSLGENGLLSKVTEEKYLLDLKVLLPPVVTPVTGEYSTEEKISVEVPAGCKAYYTYSTSGSTPTLTSTLYTEPVSMLAGNNIFSVILIHENGKTSEVTSMVYKAYTIEGSED